MFGEAHAHTLSGNAGGNNASVFVNDRENCAATMALARLRLDERGSSSVKCQAPL
jgi:hypothetical protein